MTAEYIFEQAIDLLRKRSVTGTIDAQRTASYRAAAPGLLSLWQRENMRFGSLYKTVQFSSYPALNLLGDLSNFDVREYLAVNDETFEAEGKARAYYFEADGPGTVYVEDYTNAWHTLATITVPGTVESFTPYKGGVTPTAGATRCRLRLTGATYYRTVNRALFGVPYAAGREPDYRPWIKKVMPSDFFSRDAVIEEDGDAEYTPDASAKWEGKADFYVSIAYKGNIRIVYRPVPAPITDLSQNIELDDIIAESGAYFLAQHLTVVEDPDSSNFFGARYEEYRSMTVPKKPAIEHQIEDCYGGIAG